MEKIIQDNGKLEYISPFDIERNEDNPRLYFRPLELEGLLFSISEIGVQVPISVYKKGKKYILIDGERRWRCAMKLNFAKVPAIVREEPSRLENLRMMYSIHALREQWDLFTIAIKLPVIIDLLTDKYSRKPLLNEISKFTGLTVTTINRCKVLINLPEKYKEMVHKELELPKSKQKLTEDFFVEMEKSLSTVINKIPVVIADVNHVRDVLIKKYKNGVIPNLLDLRKIPKIVKAESFGINRQQTVEVLERLFSENEYSVNQAFSEYAEDYYQEYSIENRIDWIMKNIDSIDLASRGQDYLIMLEQLRDKIDLILRRHQ